MILKMDWLTKKRAMIISLVGALSSSFVLQKDINHFLFLSCRNGKIEWISECLSLKNYSILLLIIGATTFVPVLVMYFLKNNVFESWKKTLLIYL
jgi:hypothetical protein